MAASTAAVRSWGRLPRLQLLYLLCMALLQLLRLLRVTLLHLLIFCFASLLFLGLLMFLVLLSLQLLAILLLLVVKVLLLLLVLLVEFSVPGVWSSRTFCCGQIVRMSVGSGAVALGTSVGFVAGAIFRWTPPGFIAAHCAVTMEIAWSGCCNRSRTSVIV